MAVDSHAMTEGDVNDEEVGIWGCLDPVSKLLFEITNFRCVRVLEMEYVVLFNAIPCHRGAEELGVVKVLSRYISHRVRNLACFVALPYCVVLVLGEVDDKRFLSDKKAGLLLFLQG